MVVEGPTLVAEALAAQAVVREIFVDDRFADEPSVALALDRGIAVYTLNQGVLEKILSTVTPQPIVAVIERRQVVIDDLAVDRPVLMLVDARDPGNVGTLCRTAEGAGMAGLILAGESVDPTNPKVVRAAAGASLRSPIVESPDYAVACTELRAQGRRIVTTGLGIEASHYDAVDLRTAVIVLGNEAHGLDPDVCALADDNVAIELDGPTESLNVAAAGAVLAFESLRQRRNSLARPLSPGQVVSQ
ncbi:MAG: TrmH family RNA methyltransferase [Acidimicrobiales bacterium]